MANIFPTIKVNISTNPEVVEDITVGASFSPEEVSSYKALFQEFHDSFTWSYTKIPRLDPSIIEHHIDIRTDVSPILQKKWPIHSSKAPTIKAEIEKLRKADVIYPIAYTTWVSNHVLVNKKQGTICVCIEFHDLNLDCPKDNFPTPFIKQIIDSCANHEVFSFLDGFLGYNQIQICKEDQYKTAFTTP